MNENGVIDEGVDTYYEVNHDQSCTGYLIDERHSTKCGTRTSRSELNVENTPHDKHFKWTIPKNELSLKNDGAKFVIGYHSDKNSWGYFPSASFSTPIQLTF